MSEVIAVIGGRAITRARLYERTTALRAGPLARYVPPDGPDDVAGFRRLVTRQLVTEEILAFEAEAAGLLEPKAANGHRGTELRRVLPRLIERVTGHVAVPESEVREYYERNRDRY